DDPGDGEQQPQPGDGRRGDAELARAIALSRRQAPGQDRDEDDVVDTQHQLQRGERGQGDPDFGVEQVVHWGRTGPGCSWATADGIDKLGAMRLRRGAAKVLPTGRWPAAAPGPQGPS